MKKAIIGILVAVVILFIAFVDDDEQTTEPSQNQQVSDAKELFGDKKLQKGKKLSKSFQFVVDDETDDLDKQIEEEDVEEEDYDYENDEIDWNNVPKIKNWDELDPYIRECRNARRGTTDREIIIPVILKNGFLNNFTDADFGKFIAILSVKYLNVEFVYQDKRDLYAILTAEHYNGTNIANAYLNNDTSQLTDEEMQVYNKAVQIVNQANQQPTPLRKELFLHDYIISNVEYYNKKGERGAPRYITAIGAMIDGKANCQGYTDTFYMLGTMAGFKMDRLYGNSIHPDGSKCGHVWNTIDFGDNIAYAIDVTWDDGIKINGQEYPSYVYFNIPGKMLEHNHIWNNQFGLQFNYDKLQMNLDSRYFYNTPEYQQTNGQYFGAFSEDPQAALQHISQRMVQGHRVSYIMTNRNDNGYSNQKNAMDYLVGISRNAGFNGRFNLQITNIGKYTYFTARIV